jgi:hypothetical protein
MSQIPRYDIGSEWGENPGDGRRGCMFRNDENGDYVLYSDYAALQAERDALQQTVNRWIKENAPGGWIDDLRNKNERLKGLLREYRKSHDEQEQECYVDSEGDYRCDLCKRTDQELGGEL